MKKLIDNIIEQVKQQNIFEKHFVDITKFAGHANNLAEKYAIDGVDIIVAMGGDGTLNEVLNGIMKVPNNKVILAHYPMGTANDFSKTIGLKKNLEQFLNLLKNKITIPIDVGKVKCQNNEVKVERYFLNIADAGLGGYVANKLNKSKKLLGGKLTYYKIIIMGILSFKKPKVKIKLGNVNFEGKLMSLAICNGKSFGNGLMISPEAIIDDGKFNITILGDVTIFDYFRNLKKLKRGIKLTHPDIHYYTSDKIYLTTKEKCEIEADGEYVGFGETSFEIYPKSIKIIAPTNN